MVLLLSNGVFMDKFATRYQFGVGRMRKRDDITPTAASHCGGTGVNRIFKALEKTKEALGLVVLLLRRNGRIKCE